MYLGMFVGLKTFIIIVSHVVRCNEEQIIHPTRGHVASNMSIFSRQVSYLRLSRFPAFSPLLSLHIPKHFGNGDHIVVFSKFLVRINPLLFRIYFVFRVRNLMIYCQVATRVAGGGG